MRSIFDDEVDLYSAGLVATAAGGHGTQYGTPIPTVDAPEMAAAFVADRAAEGSDWLKIILEDGSGFGREIPSLDAGADGLAHMWTDRAPDPALARRMASASIGAPTSVAWPTSRPPA